LVAYLLRHTTIQAEAQVSQWPHLPRSSATGTNFGGFIGYNSQWENLILGVEPAYNLGDNMSTQAADTIARSYQASDGYLYNVNVTSRAAMTFKDYGHSGRALPM